MDEGRKVCLYHIPNVRFFTSEIMHELYRLMIDIQEIIEGHKVLFGALWYFIPGGKVTRGKDTVTP